MNTKKKSSSSSSSKRSETSQKFTPCGCQCTSHDLVTNCHNCGYIFCIEDKRRYLASIGYKEPEGEQKSVSRVNYSCPFCATPLQGLIDYKQYEDPSSFSFSASPASLVSPPMNEITPDELKVLTHRDKLIQFDREFAKRTTIRDLQSDYYHSENNVWLSEQEKKIIQKINRKKVNSKTKARPDTKIDIHLNLSGNKITKSQVQERDIDPEYLSLSDDSEDSVGEIVASAHYHNKIRSLAQNRTAEKVVVCAPQLDQRDLAGADEEEDYYEELLFKSKSAFERIGDIESYISKNIKKDKQNFKQANQENTYKVDYDD